MTQAAVEAVVELIIERKVWQAPASKLVYLIDGGFLPNMADCAERPCIQGAALASDNALSAWPRKGAIDPDKKKSRLE